ncbi:MAG: hypothetical protein AAGA54_34965 [Myxococcota bacterium]
MELALPNPANEDATRAEHRYFRRLRVRAWLGRVGAGSLLVGGVALLGPGLSRGANDGEPTVASVATAQADGCWLKGRHGRRPCRTH